MTSFGELGLSESLLETISGLGYEEPTPVQAHAIPPLMAGKDAIAQAQTGTGKTAAFSIPIVEMVDPANRAVQALVVLPTRELAMQVAEAVHALGRARNIHVLPIYGGQAYDRQLRALQNGVQVVVGTPGRMMDHVRRGTLKLDNVRMVVLDEADEMLDMGFVEDIEFILEQVPAERQTALFSATMAPRIEALARTYLRDPERVTIAQEARTAPQTRQYFFQVPYPRKIEVLSLILDYESPASAIIFCRTKREVDSLTEALESRGYSAAAIHGDISQAGREQQLRAFRDGRAELLVATDVAARGLDIPDVSHVINYDIPDDADAYVHRVGRTGRAGKEGEAITLVTPREFRLMRFIEQQVGKRMKPLTLPTPDEIIARRREAFVEALRGAIVEGKGKAYRQLVAGLAEQYDPLAIARAAVYLAVSDASGREPVWAEVVGSEEDDEEVVGDAPPTETTKASEHGMVRLFLDAGRKQGLRPQDVVEAFSEGAGVAPSTIGTIDLYASFAFVEVKSSAAKKILSMMATFTVRGKDVHVKKAVPK